MADRFSALRAFAARTAAPRFRGRRPSTRAVLTVGGAAVLAVVGVSETTGTMAAQIDSATAEVSQIASRNFFPTPLTAQVTCQTEGSSIGSRRARVSWAAVPGATGYIVELVKKGTTDVVRQTFTVTAPTTSQGGIRDSDREVLYARVRTVNNGAISSGYMVTAEHISYKDLVTGRTECEETSGASNVANKTWENQADWTPGTPDEFGSPPAPAVLGRKAPAADEVDDSEASSAEPTDDAAKPDSESTSPESTSPESTSPESTSPESTSPESTTPESSTAQPSTTQPSTTQSTTAQSKPEAKVTIGISVRGDDRLLTISRDGVEQCTAPLEPGDAPSVNGDTVALTNGGSVKTVDTTTCAVR